MIFVFFFGLKNMSDVSYVWGNLIMTKPCSPSLESWFIFWGNHPQMAELFRLVKYYNLPRDVRYVSWLVVSNMAVIFHVIYGIVF